MISSVFLENIFTWMRINLILAVIPLVLSFFIFRSSLWEKHSGTNALSVFFRTIHIFIILIFFVFLPNAPYTMTDLIHLVRQIKDYKYFDLTDSQILYGLIPQYLIFVFLGMSCYTIAFRRFLVFMHTINVKKAIILSLKFVVPIFMSLGVFLGRMHRYNSWDILLHIPSMMRIFLSEIGKSDFYFYIIYFYFSIIILYEYLSIFYRTLLPILFQINKSKQPGE